MKKYQQYTLIFLVIAVAIFMAACASIGRPEGGPRDEMPPVFISSKPFQGATNVKSNKIEFVFILSIFFIKASKNSFSLNNGSFILLYISHPLFDSFVFSITYIM